MWSMSPRFRFNIRYITFCDLGYMLHTIQLFTSIKDLCVQCSDMHWVCTIYSTSNYLVFKTIYFTQQSTHFSAVYWMPNIVKITSNKLCVSNPSRNYCTSISWSSFYTHTTVYIAQTPKVYKLLLWFLNLSTKNVSGLTVFKGFKRSKKTNGVKWKHNFNFYSIQITYGLHNAKNYLLE